jgi:hypothetical protein
LPFEFYCGDWPADDPREYLKIPEICRFLQWWAEAAGLTDWRVAAAIPWSDPKAVLGLLGACDAFPAAEVAELDNWLHATPR